MQWNDSVMGWGKQKRKVSKCGFWRDSCWHRLDLWASFYCFQNEIPALASLWFPPCSQLVAPPDGWCTVTITCRCLCVTAGLVFLILLIYSVQSPFLPLSRGNCLLVLVRSVGEVWMLVLAAVLWARSLPSGLWDQLSGGASTRLRLPKAC